MRNTLAAPTVAILAAITVSACSTIVEVDRMQITDFKPGPNGTFSFRAPAALQYPLDTPAGEQARLDMLQGWLTQNRLCPAGYAITSRQAIQRSAYVHDVHYQGRCA